MLSKVVFPTCVRVDCTIQRKEQPIKQRLVLKGFLRVSCIDNNGSLVFVPHLMIPLICSAIVRSKMSRGVFDDR